jgi:hypothetical protein
MLIIEIDQHVRIKRRRPVPEIGVAIPVRAVRHDAEKSLMDDLVVRFHVAGDVIVDELRVDGAQLGKGIAQHHVLHFVRQ